MYRCIGAWPAPIQFRCIDVSVQGCTERVSVYRCRMRRVLLSFDYAGERRDKYDPEEKAACVLLAMLEDFNGKERRDFLVFSSSVARLVKPIVVSRRLGRVNAQVGISIRVQRVNTQGEWPDEDEGS